MKAANGISSTACAASKAIFVASNGWSNEDAYCMDILKQVKAVQQALERVSAITLENHLNTCVATAIRSDSEPEKLRVVTEIMDVFKATGKL